MSAYARLLLLAALPTLAGVCGEVVTVGARGGPAFAAPAAREPGAGLGAGLGAGPGAGPGAGLGAGLGAEPASEPAAARRLLAAAGGSAVLDCRVLRLGDKAVSWIRSRDLQILSHAGAVFTADSRVSLRVATEAEAEAETGAGAGAGAREETLHSLRIESLREADAGRYECQVNTEPKMSLFFNLIVVDAVPRVEVSVASRELWVAAGAPAALACAARYWPPPPAAAALPALHVRWLHDGRPLDLQSRQGGVSLDTERWAERARSTLTLSCASEALAGRYTCVAGDQQEDITLHVTQERPLEAMQRDQSPPLSSDLSRLSPTAAVATLATSLALLLNT